MKEETFDKVMERLIGLFQESNALNQRLNESVGRFFGEMMDASDQITIPDFDPHKYPYTCHVMKSAGEGINWPRVIESLRAEREWFFKTLVTKTSRKEDTVEEEEKEGPRVSGSVRKKGTKLPHCDSYVPENPGSSDEPSCLNCKMRPNPNEYGSYRG